VGGITPPSARHTQPPAVVTHCPRTATAGSRGTHIRLACSGTYSTIQGGITSYFIMPSDLTWWLGPVRRSCAFGHCPTCQHAHLRTPIQAYCRSRPSGAHSTALRTPDRLNVLPLRSLPGFRVVSSASYIPLTFKPGNNVTKPTGRGVSNSPPGLQRRTSRAAVPGRACGLNILRLHLPLPWCTRAASVDTVRNLLRDRALDLITSLTSLPNAIPRL